MDPYNRDYENVSVNTGNSDLGNLDSYIKTNENI